MKILKFNPKLNHLLESLPACVWQRWEKNIDIIELRLGQVLYESGVTTQYVYFPMKSIVSLLYVLEDGSSAEIAVIGFEGVVGLAHFMGGDNTNSRAVVQSAGVCARMSAVNFKNSINEAPEVLHLLLRYTQALMTQMSQTAVCNRHHTLDKQLCRWLLLSLDRMEGSEVIMTQELIANMLGVRREGITVAATTLQNAGLISYTRGHIHILDRNGLEKRSCECYEVVKKEYARLLPDEIAT
jgi:CRP-like cAMP-binding protein